MGSRSLHATKETYRVVATRERPGGRARHLAPSKKGSPLKRGYFRFRGRASLGAHFVKKGADGLGAHVRDKRARARAPRYRLAAIALPLAVATVATGQGGRASQASASEGPSGAASTPAPGEAAATGLPLPGGPLVLAPSLGSPPGPHWGGPQRPLAVPSLGSPPKAHRGGASGRRPHEHPAGRQGPLGRSFLGTFLVTCYDLTGPTATGAVAGPESVAVDPSVVPLGTHIYIDGVGPRTADDTGGAIIGKRLDIWEPSYWACAEWGVQERAVYRLAPPA
jgi:3D (Asp-Asp-Asp) domain-containing protein